MERSLLAASASEVGKSWEGEGGRGRHTPEAWGVVKTRELQCVLGMRVRKRWREK